MKLFKKKVKPTLEEQEFKKALKKIPRRRRKHALLLMEEYKKGNVLVPGINGGLKKYGQVSQPIQEQG